MSKDLNKVMIIGNLGADAEMRYTGSGKAVTNFSVAVNRAWQDSTGEKQEEVEWFRCVHWNAEGVTPYLTKGKRVYVEGRLQTRSWEHKGKKNYRTEVVVSNLILLGGPTGPAPVATTEPSAAEDSSEIPF